jgi:thermolysin
LPDLSISAAPQSSYNSGQTSVQMSVTVTRTGGSLTAGTFVDAHLFLSTNSTLDVNDTRLWRSNNSTPDFPNSYLNSYNTKTVIATMNIPNVNSGNYYILAVVDSSNYHAESNENNNITAYPITLSNVTGDAIGNGIGVMGDAKNHIDTYGQAGSYALVDRTRRANNNPHGHNGQMRSDQSIETRQYPSSTALTDNDNVWNNSSQASGIDAHIYAGLTYDYYLSQFGRNGYDGAGTGMVSIVDNNTAVNNAGWNGTRVQFYTVTSGHRSMAGAIDIVAHEWSHAVTEYESDLIYEKESGALNESYSDMAGTAVGFATGIDLNWQHGENFNINGQADRDLSNPHLYHQPDTYLSDQYWYHIENCTPTSSNDYCGVHTNSGVPNKMFYLLS